MANQTLGKTNSTIQRIAIVCALRGEAKPLIELGGFKETAPFDADLPMRYYEGKVGSATVLLAVNGVDSRYAVDQIGTNAAALSTYLLLQHFKPDILINLGTAGGIGAQDVAIGDVCVGQGNVHLHDRRIPVKQFLDYAVGAYPTLPAAKLIRELGLKIASVSTGNSFGCNETERNQLTAARSTLVDMEAAAIAWVAWEKKIPFLPIKGVSDLIDVEASSEQQFNANFKSVNSAVAVKTLEVIKHIAGKSLDELV